MRPTSIAAGLLATTSPFALATAPVVNGNPQGVQYIAVLPQSPSGVSGAAIVSSAPDGKGVNVQVSINGLPSSGGPFMYHIHVNPVDKDGNCTSGGAHLDPENVGEVVFCQADKPETCQIGDLSGKHGNITAPNFSANYVDPFLSTAAGSPAFFGNRSIVVHYANKTRITCANFSQNGAPSSNASNAKLEHFSGGAERRSASSNGNSISLARKWRNHHCRCYGACSVDRDCGPIDDQRHIYDARKWSSSGDSDDQPYHHHHGRPNGPFNGLLHADLAYQHDYGNANDHDNSRNQPASPVHSDYHWACKHRLRYDFAKRVDPVEHLSSIHIAYAAIKRDDGHLVNG